MSDTNASPVPTVHPPAALINHTDRRGLIILIAALGLSFILACFAIRAYVRVKISGPWRGDDYLIIVATVWDAILILKPSTHGILDICYMPIRSCVSVNNKRIWKKDRSLKPRGSC
jgi:hypothetical protein